jgi:integrase
VIERRVKARRLEWPFISHQDGRKIGDFHKVWQMACDANGLHGRIVHDSRRSGVRHLIQAGVDPHTVMALSRHATTQRPIDIQAERMVKWSRGGSNSRPLECHSVPGLAQPPTAHHNLPE